MLDDSPEQGEMLGVDVVAQVLDGLFRRDQLFGTTL
jgi:hypothetical protein